MTLYYETYSKPLKEVTNKDLADKHIYSFISRSNKGPVMFFGDKYCFKEIDE